MKITKKYEKVRNEVNILFEHLTIENKKMSKKEVALVIKFVDMNYKLGKSCLKKQVLELVNKIPADETYCLDCKSGFDEDSDECFRCNGKNIIHKELDISREKLISKIQRLKWQLKQMNK